MLLATVKSHNLPSKGIDFVLAFPQADLEIPVYMTLSMGLFQKITSNNQSMSFDLIRIYMA